MIITQIRLYAETSMQIALKRRTQDAIKTSLAGSYRKIPFYEDTAA